MSDNPLTTGEAGWQPPDYSDLYNTKLTPAQEQQFRSDMADRLGDLSDYDLRGAWLADAQSAANGHLPDTWKKPNHPTFSVESQYSNKYMPGGKWLEGPGGTVFVPSELTLSLYGADNLKSYFAAREPDTFLDLRQKESLPGITSGAPGKPWGLNREQLPQTPTTQTVQPDAFWVQNLKRLIQPETDPNSLLPPRNQNTDQGINYLSPRIRSDYRDV